MKLFTVLLSALMLCTACAKILPKNARDNYEKKIEQEKEPKLTELPLETHEKSEEQIEIADPSELPVRILQRQPDSKSIDTLRVHRDDKSSDIVVADSSNQILLKVTAQEFEDRLTGISNLPLWRGTEAGKLPNNAPEVSQMISQKLQSLMEALNGTPVQVDVTQDKIEAKLIAALKDGGLDQSFIPIEAKGKQFKMGSPTTEKNRSDDEPEHNVELSHNFEIQNIETTQLQWALVMGTNPSYFSTEEICTETFSQVGQASVCTDHPVENVTWIEVQQFIEKLNSTDAKYHYRLPSEAEWEFVERAGNTTAPDMKNYANFGPVSQGRTKASGSLLPNGLGLYDLQGNVREWVQDWFIPTFPMSADQTLVNPVVKERFSHFGKVTRGCSFRDDGIYCRSAFRGFKDPEKASPSLGLRLVRTLKRSS